jgi:hypothetical protein
MESMEGQLRYELVPRWIQLSAVVGPYADASSRSRKAYPMESG